MTVLPTSGRAADNWQVYAGSAVRDEAEAAEILGAAVAAMHARADSAGLRPVLLVEDEMQRYWPKSPAGASHKPCPAAKRATDPSLLRGDEGAPPGGTAT